MINSIIFNPNTVLPPPVSSSIKPAPPELLIVDKYASTIGFCVSRNVPSNFIFISRPGFNLFTLGSPNVLIP